jgi:hypothetical protein
LQPFDSAFVKSSWNRVSIRPFISIVKLVTLLVPGTIMSQDWRINMVSLVLLGAGASYGSIDASPHTPPLGVNLFSQLEVAGGIASTIPENIKTLFRNDFEEGMAAFYEHSDGDIMRFQRELACYLTQFTPGKNNTYVKLIKQLGVHRVVYSSLNYDLLFELSASLLGLNTIYGIEKQDGFVRLLKPHGSSNFWPDIPLGKLSNCTFKGSRRADIQAPIRPLNRTDTIERCIREDSVAPAIAMYAEGKAVKISPDYVERQQNLFSEVVSQSRRIFVVGVRVHLADQHIWGELGNAKGNLFFFGSGQSKDVFSEWIGLVKKKNAYFIEGDFNSSIGIMKRRLKIS